MMFVPRRLAILCLRKSVVVVSHLSCLSEGIFRQKESKQVVPYLAGGCRGRMLFPATGAPVCAATYALVVLGACWFCAAPAVADGPMGGWEGSG